MCAEQGYHHSFKIFHFIIPLARERLDVALVDNRRRLVMSKIAIKRGRPAGMRARQLE